MNFFNFYPAAVTGCRWTSHSVILEKLSMINYACLPSCHYVTSIVIAESSFFVPSPDLLYVTKFPYLTDFATNSMTIGSMLNLLSFSKRTGQRFYFYFFGSTIQRYFLIRKIETDIWALNYEEFKSDPPTSVDLSKLPFIIGTVDQLFKLMN